MPGLTKKQEKFAVSVTKGVTQSDAYRNAYDAKGMTAKQIHEEASKLMANPKVARRVAELRAPALEATKIDVDRWIQETSKYAFSEVSGDLKHADKRGYLDMMAKTLGAYEKDNTQRAESLALEVVLVKKK